MTVLIFLSTAGAGTGPFNLYSNVDGYITPFETGVAKSSLTTPPGYTSALVPNGTTTVRVQSTGACTNYIDLVIGATTTTTTTAVEINKYMVELCGGGLGPTIVTRGSGTVPTAPGQVFKISGDTPLGFNGTNCWVVTELNPFGSIDVSNLAFGSVFADCSTCNTSLTTTTTSTTQPLTNCGEFTLEGGISGRTFNYTDCDGVSRTTIVPAGDATSDCIQLPFAAGGATYIGPCGDSTLTFSYIGGNGVDTDGTFQFNLSNPLPSNITIAGAGVSLYDMGCVTVQDTPSQVGVGTITAGSTVVSRPSSSNICSDQYARANTITVNGNTLNNGDTIVIGGVTLTISIPGTCTILPCVA